MTDKQKAVIVKYHHSKGIMREVFWNIYQYLTGKIEKTPLSFYAGYDHSKCRFIYTMVNGEVVETIYSPKGEKVYTGVLK